MTVLYLFVSFYGNYLLGQQLGKVVNYIPRKWPMSSRLLALAVLILVTLVLGLSWSTKWQEWLL